MISLSGLAFSHGTCTAVIRVVTDLLHDVQSLDGRGCAIAIRRPLSTDEVTALARMQGLEFLVIPLCSPYSHLAARLWCTAVPVISVREPARVVDGAIAKANFDESTLWLAESAIEGEALRHSAEESRSRSAFTPLNSSGIAAHRGSAMKILVEASTESELFSALDEGADGLSVVKPQSRCSEGNGALTDFRSLVHTAMTLPWLLPIKVRFFDSAQDAQIQTGHDVRQYLGYRGVRMLECDDTLLDRYFRALEGRDLRHVVMILPMVTSAAEIKRVRTHLRRAEVRLGATVETPAAALRIKELVDVSSFIEIGLNDLTQYTMAWDRDVPNEERLPANRIAEPVSDLIASIAHCSAHAGVPYTLGLDLRPSPMLAAQISRLGVSSISCVAPLVKYWREAFNRCSP